MRVLLGEDSELGEADEEPFSVSGIVASAPRTCTVCIRTKEDGLDTFKIASTGSLPFLAFSALRINALGTAMGAWT